MATLTQNVYRAIDDFNSIENAIVGKGVPVPAGTPTSEYAEKVEDVFEAGKKSEYDAFWDEYQYNGFRDVYAYAFAGIGWTKKTFNPKYSIVPTNAFHLFQNSYVNLNDIYTVLDEKGLVLDFSMCTIADSAFYGCYIEKLRRLDFTSLNSASDIFSYSARLHTIEALVIKETTKFYNLFVNCSVLTNLIIEGIIGQNGFDVSWSPLNKASLVSIINALSDTTTGLTVTLRASAVKKAFETSEGANDGDTSDEWLQLIATKPNWTINLINS